MWESLPGPLAGIAGLANWAVILLGIVIALRGRIDRDEAFGILQPASPLS
ncbi:hypothetical protein [Compostimonas suwonensis]|nr:hypothetical protein [Compostimonas suwonensis]